MRSRPKALRPFTSRSFNSVPFPFELFFHVSEVLYLFLWLIIVYITTAVYLLLSKKQASTFPNRFTGCHNTYNIKDVALDEILFYRFHFDIYG
jgi:hypothetical protein